VSIRQTLAERDIRLLVGGQFVNAIGTQMVPVALTFAVLDLTGSATKLGIVMSARVLPGLVVFLIGGALADRAAPHRLMILTDATNVIVQAATAVMLAAGTLGFWDLVALQFISGAATSLGRPGSTALTPLLVAKDRLAAVNGLRRSSSELAGVAGPALAGLLFAAFGASVAFGVDAATYLVSVVTLLMLRPRPRPAREASSPIMRDIAAGWRVVRHERWLILSIGEGMTFQLLVVPAVIVLGPLLASEQLGGARAWGLLLAAMSVGAVTGGVLSARLHPRRPLVTAISGTFLAAPILLLLPITTSIVLLAAAMVACGVSLSLFDTLWETTIQTHVPDEMIGRVDAWDWFASFLARPVGLVLIGPIAARLGVDTTLTAAGIAISICAALFLAAPSIRGVTSASVETVVSVFPEQESAATH
jgi:MFS family permease